MANWLERTGAPPRLRADPLAAADPGPQARGRAAGRGGAVRASLAGRLPYYEQARVTPEEYAARIAARQAAVADPDAGLMALLDRARWSWSPGSARTSAGRSRCAARAAGADVVLAARTAARLEDVAKEITELGRRALAVPTDITDAARRAAGRGRAGRVRPGRRAGAQRAGDAADRRPGTVDLDAIRAGFENNVIAALRMTRLFIPALAATPGLGRDGQLDGGAASPSGPWARTRWPRRRCWRWRRAWPPSSARRASGSTRWRPATSGATSLKWYFGYLAEKRGVDAEEIYEETAASIDLGRLPEPDEIADAVLFLASPGPRHHRPVPRRQLRRVPPLSARWRWQGRRGAGTPRVGTVEDLHASASRMTGLTDFGADDYRDGLAVLLESYARDAGPDPAGQRVSRACLRGALAARLLSEAAWAAHPAHAAVPDRAARCSSPGCRGPGPPRCTGC